MNLRVSSKHNDPMVPKHCQAASELSGMMKKPRAKDEFLLFKCINQRMKLKQFRDLVAMAMS